MKIHDTLNEQNRSKNGRIYVETLNYSYEVYHRILFLFKIFKSHA